MILTSFIAMPSLAVLGVYPLWGQKKFNFFFFDYGDGQHVSPLKDTPSPDGLAPPSNV